MCDGNNDLHAQSLFVFFNQKFGVLNDYSCEPILTVILPVGERARAQRAQSSRRRMTEEHSFSDFRFIQL